MDWKRAVREAVLIVIIIISAYCAFYFTQHKTDFMYTSIDSNASYSPLMKPYEDCKSTLSLERVCSWVNLPHGESEIQLKQNNPFVYFIWSNQILLGIAIVLFFILVDIEKAKRMFQFFKNLKIE